ncbi:MAG TPA: HAMP domain-containing sensor histidine kinase [Anaerolineales bacterium]|nr:HAMP domain-containing sensor histidine kinase [Anaerolineales bacterium]
MSLRLRLTLLYSTLVGGILLIFGSAVYILISVILLNQVDNTLAATVQDIINVTRVNSEGEISAINLPSLDLTANTYVQVWGRDGKLKSASPGIAGMMISLDPIGLDSKDPIYRENIINGIHLRVLTVPLQVGVHRIAALQVASSLTVVDSARANLLNVLLLSAILSAALAALGSWLVLGRSLAPLDTVAETAQAINRADDLSRRIPYSGPETDEIGRLIQSFNQTLERLENLFTSQRRLLADVSHELRTPLTVIKGNVDLMRRMNKLDEESLSNIDQEAGRLTRLVGGLLLLAQAESGKLTLDMKPVEVDTLLLEVFQEMRVLAGSRIKMKLGDMDQAVVKGDRDRLKQVLLNLVGNAIQYTPAGGEVLVSLAKIGEQVRIIVRDTGPGIPAEDLPFIFERFYRAEKARTRGTSTGFGLGLSIAQWIVENHGGTVEVESKEGQGTTFAIWLPLLPGQSKPQQAERAAEED